MDSPHGQSPKLRTLSVCGHINSSATHSEWNSHLLQLVSFSVLKYQNILYKISRVVRLDYHEIIRILFIAHWTINERKYETRVGNRTIHLLYRRAKQTIDLLSSVVKIH